MNKKGFTLVELLAAIVILGIIMTIALPNIFRIMSESKADKYIDDAKKLISNADYKMRTNSNYIKKPSGTKCVVMTLSYLDGPEFDVAPEGGQYDREYSYVIIKSNGGVYSYIVSLVEDVNAGKKTKEGDAIKSNRTSFKGISLATEADLKDKNVRGKVDGIPANKIKLYTDYTTGCNASNWIVYSLDKDQAATRP